MDCGVEDGVRSVKSGVRTRGFGLRGVERWCHHSLVNSFSLEAKAKKMWQKLESTFRSRDVWPKDMNIKIRTT